jgi:hypothetical protein
MAAILIGALLFAGGIVYMAGAALNRGRLSDPAPARTPDDSYATIPATQGPTLEPSRRGLGFLGLASNWPGLLMMAAGAVLLLFGLIH